MSAPTLTSQTGSTWTDQVNTDEVTGTLTWNSGDRILVVGFTEDQSLTLGTPTATGLTFGDLGTPITTANSCWMHAWQATAGSSGSGAVTGPRATGTGTGMRGIEAYAYGNCTGFTRTDGAGANSTQTVSVTRGQANSGMVFASADWSAGGTGGLAWTPAGQTQDQAAHNASGATAFAAHWGDQGSTGTTSYGTSGLAGTVFNKFAVEVLGTVSAGPVPWAPRQQARTPDPGETYWAQSRRLDMGPLAAANPLAIPLLNASSVAQRAAVLARTSWSRQVPQLANQGAAAGVAYDPTLAPPMRSLAAYTSRLVYPQQRSYPAAPDPTTTVGAGALGAWWSVDDGAHFGPAQRRQLADQSSAAGTPFDPTLAGYGWVAELAAVTHRDRRRGSRSRSPRSTTFLFLAQGLLSTGEPWTARPSSSASAAALTFPRRPTIRRRPHRAWRGWLPQCSPRARSCECSSVRTPRRT